MSTPYQSSLNIDPCKFSRVVKKLRDFFLSKGFEEVHTQNRLSILAACEDPFTISTFDYAGTKWPLPQTGQMWLEYEMLRNPNRNGLFCLTTSYREEPEPIEGRHDLIFPLFEFEMRGDMEALIKLEMELLEYLGYDTSKFIRGRYDDVRSDFGVEEVSHVEEMKLTERTPTFFLTDFTEDTSPFWNMKRSGETAKKVDVILSGQETFGSAERETDPEVMRDRFNNIMDGKYKEKLYEHFGEERTLRELKEYLELEFFERSGGGIGMTRLIRSMNNEGLL